MIPSNVYLYQIKFRIKCYTSKIKRLLIVNCMYFCFVFQMDKNEKNAVDPLQQNSNAWKVNEVSAFLKYCCPECIYSDSELDVFIEHAVENHEDSSVLFSEKSYFKDPKENDQTSEIDVKEECLEIGKHSQTFVNHIDHDIQSPEFESDNTTAGKDTKSTFLLEYKVNENRSVHINQTTIKVNLVHRNLSKDDNEINDQNVKSIPVTITRKPKHTKKCVVPFCQTRHNIGMHKFPDDPVKREVWTKLCRLKQIKKDDRICSLHFKHRLLDISKVSSTFTTYVL